MAVKDQVQIIVCCNCKVLDPKSKKKSAKSSESSESEANDGINEENSDEGKK